MDESQSEPRPLQREVEPPRTAAGLWLPLMALASAAMLTVVSGIAVMTHQSPAASVQLMAPSVDANSDVNGTGDGTARPRGAAAEELNQLDAARERARSPETRALCRAAVQRGDVDGRGVMYDECILDGHVVR